MHISAPCWPTCRLHVWWTGDSTWEPMMNPKLLPNRLRCLRASRSTVDPHPRASFCTSTMCWAVSGPSASRSVLGALESSKTFVEHAVGHVSRQKAESHDARGAQSGQPGRSRFAQLSAQTPQLEIARQRVEQFRYGFSLDEP